MQLRKLLMLFISTSYAALTHIEPVPYEGAVYVMDTKNKGAQRSTHLSIDCARPENVTQCFVPWELMDNFICVAPEDSTVLIKR